MVGLYIHVPLCVQKCDYCHFYVIPEKQEYKDLLVESLKIEWQKYNNLKDIRSIYFGGGTPFLLGPKFIADILKDIPYDSDAEITIEANPESIDLKTIREYVSLGINRISIGIQSFSDKQLLSLSRKHNAAQAYDSVMTSFSGGFNNISIDLMYDIPGQTLHSWNKTLNKALELPITHVSIYNLVIEPHTVFFKYRDKIKKLLPDENTSLKMFTAMQEVLSDFQQYEISAFCKRGYHSRHNTGYWTGQNFIGLGPSAFSYWDGRRFRNKANLHYYGKCLREGKSPVDFEETLPPEKHIKEMLAVQLRLLEGVNLEKFQEQHGKIANATLRKIEDLIEQNLLQKYGDSVKLTKQGILFYDTIATEII